MDGRYVCDKNVFLIRTFVFKLVWIVVPAR